MGLETATYISDLVATNPLGSDGKDRGDDHLRLLKSTIKTTFPNISGAVTPTHTELNFVDGVTSAIQSQIDSKGAVSGQTWTGTHTFPATAYGVTATVGDNSTKLSTTEFVTTAIASATLSQITSTSTTSLAISIASKSLTTQTGKSYQAGFNFVSLISNANPANYMIGNLTAYNSGTGAMTVNVTAIGGGGTFTDWNISLSGAPGATGTTAATLQQTLTDAATINWDWNSGRIGVVTLGGNRTIAAPTNLVVDTFILRVIQDGTGSRTLTWNSIYKWGGGVAAPLSTVAGRTDIFSGYYDGTNIHITQFSQGSR